MTIGAKFGVNPHSEDRTVTEKERRASGRRREDRRKSPEQAKNWLAEERRKSERRVGERRQESVGKG